MPHASTTNMLRAEARGLMSDVRAFTLIEVIVVIILLGVLAGVLLPRLGLNTSRAARTEAMALRDMLTVAAERDALAGASVALEYDAKEERFNLLTLRQVDDRDAVTAQWRPDPLVTPVQMSLLAVRSAEADAKPLDIRRGFILDMAGDGLAGGGMGGIRPSITIVLVPRAMSNDARGVSASQWRIELAPESGAAVATSGDHPASPTRVIDLDATGRSEDPW
jgi:prepilin-type N-terminal cleavage/methylation domain-containing protein